MREISFRGRSIINCKYSGIKVGGWIFGSFIHSGVDAPCIIFGDGEQCEIDIKTLGQYTGLKDCEGKKIFEGDIIAGANVQYAGLVFFDDSAAIYSVKIYEDGEHIETMGLARFIMHAGRVYDYSKIIGNEHENPGLLNA